MESQNAMIFGGVLLMLLLTCATTTSQPTTAIDCATVTTLLSSCTTFITYGTPDPIPGSPCCDAMTSLNLATDSTDSRRSICRCLMSLITTYNPNATAIATLPGFCGVTLGFTIDPNTDCNNIAMGEN
ncbi:hypothetical protein Dsin_014751 [Dipteronia sinensis]|uniref:Non-specific lipid-transfer protein n=1 Tax=Dipteronia sinensis TaxID=43782 RepID=A0AAE0AMD3_9ROSI|nr:hypothetical protein Dsin_014751 [Dipteronia sinensis]